MTKKEYNLYKRRIITFAKNHKVSIIFKTDEFGEYNYYRHSENKKPSEIVLRRNQSSNKKIAILLHELGHFLDYKGDKKKWKVSKKAYNTYAWKNNLPLNKFNKEVIVKAESRAWENALFISIILSIPRKKWFSYYKKQSLGGYKKLPVATEE